MLKKKKKATQKNNKTQIYWHMYFLAMYVDFISLQKPVVFREEVTQKSGQF